jgi:hypothetical protein
MPFNPKSLENLKPEKRSQDKQRRNFTLLPATVEWLGKQPNASAAIDRLVAVAGDSDSEVIPFRSLLRAAWEFLATEQVGKQIEGHPVGLKELHDRCFPYLKWERFLDLVGGVRVEGMELIPSRDRNYLVRGRQVGSIGFYLKSYE